MGVVSVTTFSTDTETVTKTKLNGLAANLVTEFNGSIDNANIKAAAGIVGSKLDLASLGAIGGTAPAAGAFTTLSAVSAATTTDITTITGNSLTTGKGLSLTSTSTARTEDNLLHVTHIGDSAGANTGKIAYFESDDNDTGTRDVVSIKNTDAAATGATCLGVDQVSTNAGVDVNCTGNGPHVRMIGDPTVASPTDGDLWYTGSALNFRDGASTVDLLVVPAGGQVQVVNVMDSAVTVCATQVVFDDSIPTYAEGVEVMTLAITPTNASNKLRIDVVANGSATTNAAQIITALFQDATGSDAAIAAVGDDSLDSAGKGLTTSFTHYMTAGTTSETTFQVRFGSVGAGGGTFNGVGVGRKLGGVMASSITITEIMV